MSTQTARPASETGAVPADQRTRQPALLPFVAMYAPWLLALVGVVRGDWWLLATPLVIFIAVPLADLICRGGPLAPPTSSPSRLARHIATWLPRLAAVMQLALLIVAAAFAGERASLLFLVAGAVAVGTSAGAMGVVAAHELIHRHRRVDRFFAELVLVTVGHMHWTIEHLGGHHRTIGLRGDPGTAALGETSYAFWWRYLVGSYRVALGLERQRGKKTDRHAFSVKGRMLWYTTLPPLSAIALGVAFGWQAFFFVVLQAAVSFALLGTVNYVEHYGLVRHTDADGRSEPIGPQHSWDTNCVISGYVLLNLQLHADHHVHPARSFDRLASGSGPQMPTGYMGMFWLALFPRLWRRVMDPAALRWRQTLPTTSAANAGSTVSEARGPA